MLGFGAVIDSVTKAIGAAASAALEALRIASGGRRPKPIPIPIPVEDGRGRSR